MSTWAIHSGDELEALGWSRTTICDELARIEALQFKQGPYTAEDFADMLAHPGGYCALIFPSLEIRPGGAIGIAGCREPRVAGTGAHQLVTIAIAPHLTGHGRGLLLDERCEAFAADHGYCSRVLRSRAPASVYTKLGNRDGGSPHGEATRFALKRGFQVLSPEEARGFFGADIATFHELDVALGSWYLQACPVAESYPQGPNADEPPWYFICMSKSITTQKADASS